MTTAFVLGGGGVLGAAEVGMLRALIEADIWPDVVLGTSVGALNGSMIAAYPGPARIFPAKRVIRVSSADPSTLGPPLLRERP